MYHRGPQTRHCTHNAIDELRVLRWLYSRGRLHPLPYVLHTLPDATDLYIIEIDKLQYETHYKDNYTHYVEYQQNHGKRRSARISAPSQHLQDA